MATLVIEVTPDLEKRLQEEAARRRQQVGDYARAVLEGEAGPPAPREAEPGGARAAAAAGPGSRQGSAFGKYAGLIPTSEEFMREKRLEVEREERGPQ